MLVANDNNFNRATMLANQVDKYNSINSVVTVCESYKFPTNYKFDKIICDAPCSGDGTMRKNTGILENWNFITP